ncbi:MAG: ABC transporter ATP-binding protein [Lentisphaeria bacterium]
MIELRNISRSLGGKPVLNGLNLCVENGQTQVIVGASGTGKSVTLRHIIGLLTPDDGSVTIEGSEVGVAKGSELERIRNRFGVLFQSGALINWMNVFDNVALPLYEKTDWRRDRICDTVDEKLALVGMEHTQHKMPAELSGGMRKRVGLARAIVMEPDIILYDEPTSGLDPVLARSIDRLIRDLQAKMQVTSIVVTHDLHSAFYIGDRIAMLHEGRVVANCPPSEFAEHQSQTIREFVQAQFGNINAAKVAIKNLNAGKGTDS